MKIQLKFFHLQAFKNIHRKNIKKIFKDDHFFIVGEIVKNIKEV